MHCLSSFFFFNDPATTEIYTLSLHDALPISAITYAPSVLVLVVRVKLPEVLAMTTSAPTTAEPDLSLLTRSEEHTSELQSRRDLVCRLLLEKKKIIECSNKGVICHAIVGRLR